MALSEVVPVLEADAHTDWDRVDLAGLRAHPMDMARLVSEIAVTETKRPEGLATFRRLVLVHAAQLASDNHWTVETSKLESGMELRLPVTILPWSPASRDLASSD
ncbi:hypothetical protein [Tateyamaria pelophila]|uniref:hypothetical protein n=1 Tax=Tateyamaria pelophila TaxID=328415 RepID=UPI001CBBD090|nr:hypothetical protein [Tateyamaria pelophila]